MDSEDVKNALSVSGLPESVYEWVFGKEKNDSLRIERNVKR
jgi:hypothetical protein